MRDLKHVSQFSLLLILLLVGCKKGQPSAPEEPQPPPPQPPPDYFWEPCVVPKTAGPTTEFIFGRNGILFASIASYSTSGSVLRSLDTGKTWTTVVTGTSSMTLAVDSNGNLYIDGAFIFRSTNDGTSWDNLGQGLGGFVVVLSNGWILDVEGNGTICQRSTNGGQSWVPAAQVGGYAIYLFYHKRTNTVYVNTTYHGNRKLMWSSSNNGDSWSLVQDFGGDMYQRRLAVDSTGRILLLESTGGVHIGFGPDVISRISTGGYTPTLQVHPSGKLLAGGTGFYISSDGGLSWLADTSGMNDTQVRGIGILPDGRVLAGTQSGQIYRSKRPISN